MFRPFHTQPKVYMYALPHIYAYGDAHSYTQAQVGSHIITPHLLIHSYVNRYTHTYSYTQKHTCTLTHTYTLLHTEYRLSHTNTVTYFYMHKYPTCLSVHAQIYSYTNRHILICTVLHDRFLCVNHVSCQRDIFLAF